MAQKVTPFLMFEGKAEEAINFYISVFENSRVVSIRRYGPGETGAEGSVMQATMSLAGQLLMFTDSPLCTLEGSAEVKSHCATKCVCRKVCEMQTVTETVETAEDADNRRRNIIASVLLAALIGVLWIVFR